ncbi:hypothetical protein JB92DRAFT_2880434 [Gautieria morchelliformis]|nr:hypothetical protein JB92DRAFT_2880434 [Gautieria morchelliformis]
MLCRCKNINNFPSSFRMPESSALPRDSSSATQVSTSYPPPSTPIRATPASSTPPQAALRVFPMREAPTVPLSPPPILSSHRFDTFVRHRSSFN